MTTTLRSSDGRVIVPARLRRRRVDVRRDQGRRRLRRVLALGILVALAVGAWALLRSPLLAVHTVAVEGSSHVTRAEVEKATGIRPGAAMFDVSPGRAADRLEALPWVATAKVSRQWPDRVQVRLTDRRPVARVVSGRTASLVDRTGRVLQVGDAGHTALPQLTGVRPVPVGRQIEGAQILLRTVAVLPAHLRNHVAGFRLAKDRSVVVELASGGKVDLGGGEDLVAKYASLSTMLDHLGGLKSGCTLDVSVPASPTLTPEYGCA